MASLPDRRRLAAVGGIRPVLVVPGGGRRRPAEILVADDVAQEGVAHLDAAIRRRQAVGHGAQGDFRHRAGQAQAAGRARSRGDGRRPFRRHDESGSRIVQQPDGDRLQFRQRRTAVGGGQGRSAQVRDGEDGLAAVFHRDVGLPAGQFRRRARVRGFQHPVGVEDIESERVHRLLRAGRRPFRGDIRPVDVQGGISARDGLHAAGQHSGKQEPRRQAE